MAEVAWPGRPERPLLRRAIRHRLRDLDPSIRVVAEDFLAETSPIDLLAVGSEGEMISLRIGRDGDDRALLTRSLSDLAWLRPRLTDLLKIAPGLGIEPSAEPRALVVCPTFSHETVSATRVLPDGAVELIRYRCLSRQHRLTVVLDRLHPTDIARGPEGAGRAAPEPLEDRGVIPDPVEPPPPPPRLATPPGSSSFRTGLTDADLRLAPRQDPAAPGATPSA